VNFADIREGVEREEWVEDLTVAAQVGESDGGDFGELRSGCKRGSAGLESSLSKCFVGVLGLGSGSGKSENVVATFPKNDAVRWQIDVKVETLCRNIPFETFLTRSGEGSRCADSARERSGDLRWP
jgi:hypothetical protein